MNFLALPMFAVDPTVMMPPAAAATEVSDQMGSAVFAGLLLEVQASDVPETLQEAAPQTAPEATEFKNQLLKEPATPADLTIESSQTDSPQRHIEDAVADSAARAYALVITMPTLQPTQLGAEQSVEQAALQTSPQSELPLVAEKHSITPSATGFLPEQTEPEQQELTSESAQYIQAPPLNTNEAPQPSSVAVSSLAIVSPPAGPLRDSADSISPGQQAETRSHANGEGVPQDRRAIPVDTSDTVSLRPVTEPVILEARITRKEPSAGKAPPATLGEASVRESSGNVPATRVQEAERPELSDGLPQQHEETETQATSAKQPPSQATEGSPRLFVESVSSDRSPTVRPSVAEQPQQAARTPEDNRPLAGERTPLRAVEVRIPDGDSGGVTVRMQERAGSVQVSVRSADPNLSGKVAEGIPDLTRNLDRQGFRAEVWTPQDAKISHVEVRPEAMLNRQPEAAAGAQMESARHESNSSEQENQEHRQRKPDWEEEQNERRRPKAEENFEEHLW